MNLHSLGGLRWEGRTAFPARSLWDRYDMLSLLKSSEELGKLDGQQRDEFEYSLVQDSFYALRGIEADVLSPIGAAWDGIMDKPEFKRLRGLFVGSKIGRLAAVQELAETIADNLRGGRAVEEQNSPVNETPTEAGEGKGGPVPSQEEREGAEGAPTGVPGLSGSLAAAYMADSKIGFTFECAQEVTAAGDLIYSFLTEGSPVERAAQAKKLAHNIKLKHLSEFLGWAKRIVGGEARRSRSIGTGALTGYRAGAVSPQLAPVELALLALDDRAVTDDFMMRAAGDGVTLRELEDEQPRGRGPVVLLRDESSSMQGERHQTAQALELALADAFNREGRDLVSIAWSSRGTRKFTYGEPGVELHISSFIGGNTRIDRALAQAVEVAEEYRDGADILILSDGMLQEDPHSPGSDNLTGTLERYRKMGGRCWALLVGNAASGQQRLDWVDGWVHVDDLENTGKMSDLVGRMARPDAKAAGRRRL